MAVDTDRLDHLYLALIALSEEMAERGMAVEDELKYLETRLGQRGENLLEIVRQGKEQLGLLQNLLLRSPDDSELLAQAFTVEERYDSNKTALFATIHMMSELGLDYVDLQVETLAVTHEVTPEALDLEVAAGLFGSALKWTKDFLAEYGPKILLRLLVVVAVLAVFWILARLVRALTSKTLEKTSVASSQLLREMIVTMAGRIVMFIGLVIILSQFGVSLGPLLAGLGVAGLVIGFALQDTLSNFASGAMILAYQPFDVGDLVETAGVEGTVKDLNLVSTRIMTLDHQTLIVPNSKIWGDVIRNVTDQSIRRVDLVFGISYEDNIRDAERLLHEIVESNEKVLDTPETKIKVHTLNDSSVDFIVRPWTKTEDYWDVYWDLTRAVKLRFDEAGISIPYPQRDVHLIREASDQDS